MVFRGHCHLRFDNRGAVIVDNAPTWMKYQIMGLAGSIVPNPIQLTRFCNVSDMNLEYWDKPSQPCINADGF
jgi:hypothetical protein